MSKHPSFPFYVQDFLVGTAEFTPEEVGGYIRLICYEWEKGKIPNDLKKIKQLTGCRSNAVASILTKFFIGNDGHFYQKRLEIERVKKIEYSNKQSAKANKKWGKSDAVALPMDMPETSQTDASHIHTHISLPKGKDIKEKFIKGKFIEPSIEEVESYFLEKQGTKEQAQYYFDTKTANGWMVGKNKLKNWKADANKWIRSGWGINQLPFSQNGQSNGKISDTPLRVNLKEPYHN